MSQLSSKESGVLSVIQKVAQAGKDPSRAGIHYAAFAIGAINGAPGVDAREYQNVLDSLKNKGLIDWYSNRGRTFLKLVPVSSANNIKI